MIQTFEFSARDLSGRKLKGVLNAGSQSEVIQHLSRHGYTVTHCAVLRRSHHILGRKVPLKELSVMCRQLSSLIRAGLHITQAIRTIRDQLRDKQLQRILDQVMLSLSAGESIYHAFEKHAASFPSLFLHLLYAAETTGSLDKKLQELASHFQKEYQVRKKIQRAMIYPAFILIFAAVLIYLLLLYALPAFISVFAAEGSLPLLTRILWDASQIINRYGVFLVPGSFLAVYLL
jgi:type IV pilus assembly protein PilC